MLLERSACHPFSESGFYTSSPSSSTRRRSSWEDSCSSAGHVGERCRKACLSRLSPGGIPVLRIAPRKRDLVTVLPRPSLGFGARLIFLFSLLLVLIFTFLHWPPPSIAGRQRPPLEDKCAHLAKEHDLTEREAVVLVPLGHTMKSIAEHHRLLPHRALPGTQYLSETGHSFARGAFGYARIATSSIRFRNSGLKVARRFSCIAA